ncbi:MAG: NAD(P)-dependent oxidoreductase [Actinomycetota bacterium]|nr:NAD(P)-dependent oxidoreductase [Actinomycetota bacterium]
MRVLITGASGHIGSVLADRLDEQFEIRGLDVRAAPASYRGEFVVGDCADPVVATEAVRDMDAVVHLAGIATEADLLQVLHGHVLGTAALLDAMVRHGVRRMVLASSNHAVGMTPRPASGEPIQTGTPPRPDTFYGVGKVAAEALLSLYADRHGISSVALRIGSFLERPTSRRNLATWLSYDDCVAMVEAGLVADFEGVVPIYGISANRDAWWDLDAGRSIGYHPRDDAAAYEHELPHAPEDEAEAQWVGGPFATGAPTRTAFELDDVSEGGGT